MAAAGGGNFSDATNLDAIAEVNVQLNNYTAEYGLKGGPQVNLITKHGGTGVSRHGLLVQACEMFNATNFFNNQARISTSRLPVPDARRQSRRTGAGQDPGV